MLIDSTEDLKSNHIISFKCFYAALTVHCGECDLMWHPSLTWKRCYNSLKNPIYFL